VERGQAPLLDIKGKDEEEIGAFRIRGQSRTSTYLSSSAEHGGVFRRGGPTTTWKLQLAPP